MPENRLHALRTSLVDRGRRGRVVIDVEAVPELHAGLIEALRYRDTFLADSAFRDDMRPTER
jgi:hypothetical protein